MRDRDIPPCRITIDKEGNWFYDGAEMIHEGIIRHFYRHMEVDSGGRYIINWQGQRCYLEVEDTPFIVTRALWDDPGHTGESRVILYLNDGGREDLYPESLTVGEDHVLYCRVRDGGFPARFSRAAYYQFAEHIEEENGAFFLPLNGKRYIIYTA